MKIITGAVGLAQLGAGYRWRTTLVAGGPVVKGRLEGDLIVFGTGDPTFSDHARKDALAPMREIAESLAARGITSISGKIVAAGDPFPGPKLGAAWSWDYLGEDYGAGFDALYFNEGFARVAVRGAGDSVALSVSPATGFPIVRRGALRLSADSTKLSIVLDSVRGEFVASGNLKRGTVDTVNIVYPDQRAAWLHALGQPISALGDRRSAVESGSMAAPARVKVGDTLVVFQSPTLGEVLPLMEKPSQNQIAEIIFHTIGLEKAGAGSEDSARAVVARQLVAWGALPEGFIIKDGSGLSRKDYVSPETLARVLAAMRDDSVWLAALPLAGVDGSLEFRFRGTPAAGNVHAKTGSLENVRSLSGYLSTAGGRRLIFVLLCNNFSVPQSHVDSAQEAIVQLLVAPRR